MYYPTSQEDLISISVLDIFASAYSCENDHRFLCYEKEVLSDESDRAVELDSPISPTASDLCVIEYWLSNEDAREHLNGQLAEMLQNIYWSSQADKHTALKGSSFVYCSICREKLEHFEQDDCWLQGKRCNNGHKYYERGGKMNYTIDGKSAHLVREMPREVLASLVTGWLKNNPVLEPQLHYQIRNVFEHYGD